MTDKEMLERCRLAFEATLTSATSRKMLKQMGITPGAYAGTGQHLLAREMFRQLSNHLNSED